MAAGCGVGIVGVVTLVRVVDEERLHALVAAAVPVAVVVAMATASRKCTFHQDMTNSLIQRKKGKEGRKRAGGGGGG